jgi:hypothetical protein
MRHLADHVDVYKRDAIEIFLLPDLIYCPFLYEQNEQMPKEAYQSRL